MAEYIDRKSAITALISAFAWGIRKKKSIHDILCAAKDRLQKILAADVAPVVRGSWCLIISDFDDNALQCSICGKELKIDDDADISEYRACPFCTAIMDGGNDNV